MSILQIDTLTGVEAELAQAVARLRPRMVATRRDFHKHPELSGEEMRTAQVVAERLRALDFDVVTSEVGGHGVIGLLRGARSGPVIAYRADMDALPIEDALAGDYRSLAPGVKHACGHDAHMAIALGAAEVLAARREIWPGTIKFIFQPAEEALEGARAMIAAGVLNDPRPEAIVALHTFPIRAGWLGVSPGLALAGMEEFRIRLYSPAGHLSMLMARISSALRDLSSAQAPAGPATFDALVRRMRTDEALADTVLISCWPYIGDLSSTHHLMGLSSVCTAERRDLLHQQIRETLDRCVARVGASYDLDYTFANPPVFNDLALTEALCPAMEAAVGAGRVLRFRAPYPFAHEDFALYQEHIPGLFIWLGIANQEAEIDSLLHQPDFDIDEDALVVGARLMVLVLKRFLQAKEAQAARDARQSACEALGA